MDAEYWYRNLRQTVQFAPAVRAMAQDGVSTMIEVGPHPVLTAAVQEMLEAPGRPPNGLRRSARCAARMAGSSGSSARSPTTHASGIEIDWTALFGVRRRRAGRAAELRVPAPPLLARTRPRRGRPQLARAGRRRASAARRHRHRLPAAKAPSSPAGFARTHPWLADHLVMGTVLLPRDRVPGARPARRRVYRCPRRSKN